MPSGRISWLVPTIEVIVAVALFAVTNSLDEAAYHGHLTLPSWVNHGSADAAREILTAIAAAVITVVGLVFSITIVALTLASTPVRLPGCCAASSATSERQVTLGTFVATFVYAVLALGSVSHGGRADFVPHVSITVALGLVLASLGVLIYFIHHVTKSIQLPEVSAGIGRDLAVAIDAEAVAAGDRDDRESGQSVAELQLHMERSGLAVAATQTGYLQFVAYDVLVGIAAQSDAVIRLLHRPGHFVVEGLPMARVWPAEAAEAVTRSLERGHFTGPNRTLTQDLSFAIDQLVEIAIRALSPAVNDTFTALTCIDWLSDGMCKVSAHWNPTSVQRDASGQVRVMMAERRYEQFVKAAFDKIRQASTGMPSVMIRQLDALARVMVYASTAGQGAALRDQADMILRASESSVPEEVDRDEVRAHYDAAGADRSTAGQRLTPGQPRESSVHTLRNSPSSSPQIERCARPRRAIPSRRYESAKLPRPANGCRKGAFHQDQASDSGRQRPCPEDPMVLRDSHPDSVRSTGDAPQ